MQEMANVTQVSSSMAARLFQPAIRQPGQMGGVFDDVLSAMMASLKADPTPRTDAHWVDSADSGNDLDVAPRASATDEAAPVREADKPASTDKRDADNSGRVTGAEGSFAAQSQKAEGPKDADQSSSAITERDAKAADEADSKQKPEESEDGGEDSENAAPQSNGTMISISATSDVALAPGSTAAQSGDVQSRPPLQAQANAQGSAQMQATEQSAAAQQANSGQSDAPALDVKLQQPEGKQVVATPATSVQPQAAAPKASDAQTQPTQPNSGDAKVNAQQKPEAAASEAVKGDATQQAAKPAQQAKPEGADNAPKPWDVQYQDAPRGSGNPAVVNQQPTFAQTVSNDAAQQPAQAAQQTPTPDPQTPAQFQVNLPNTDVSGDSKNGSSSNGKGSETAAGRNAQNVRSDAAEQGSEAQRSEFAQKLGATRNAARADQAETIDKIVKSMTMAVKRGEGEVRIMLQPAKLGSVRIELNVKDGVLNASFETQTQAARHVISSNLPMLKAALESQGIEVGGFNVTVEQESGQSNFTDDRGALPNFTAGDGLSVANEEDDNYDIFDEKRRMSAGTSLVDYFV